jgi:hypothetical protein
MNFTLLLADPSHPTGSARAAPLHVQVLETSPGGQDVTVAFQPNRADDLHSSAKVAAQLAYRILLREGLVRSQMVVRLRPNNAPQNVVGRSAELLLTLAIVLHVYEQSGQPAEAAVTPPFIAATGALASDGSVLAIEHLGPKLEAACEYFGGSPAIVFVPAANGHQLDLPLLSRQYPNLQFKKIGHLDEALEQLGIVLERVYLQNPFRGLECFEYRHRAIFFGREAETIEVVAQLLRRETHSIPGLLIEGASGSGKSSFLRAGLLPALVNPRSQPADIIESLRSRPVRSSVSASIWRIGPVSRTYHEAQIAQSILDCWRGLPEFAGKLSAASVSFAALAEECRTHWPATHRFVWAIDQLEELFTPGLDAELIDAFGRFLLLLQHAGAWTIGCIRSDALPQLKQYDSLRQVFGSNEGQYYLPTMTGSALEDVITRPAEVAGLTFGVAVGGKRLDQVLREDVYAARENTLPQLQFTLNELYMSRSGSELTYPAYSRLGGLTGSIASTATAVINSEQKDSRGAIRNLFRNLVSVDEQGNASRRYAPMAEIDDPVQQRVLARLVAARLCVAALRDDQAIVSFAHEALLRTWPELIEWLREETGLLQMREMAQRDARQWQQHEESSVWLAPADKVAAFEALHASGIVLTAPVRKFLEHSRRRVLRTTRIKQTIFAVISLLAIVASVTGWVASKKQREAQYQVAETLKAQARLLVENAAQRLKDGDVAGAQRIIVEVLTNPEFAQEKAPNAISVFQEIRAADKVLAVLSGHSTIFRFAAYSPDGLHIVTASYDKTARIWDARTGVQLAVLSGHDGEVESASYSPDGTRIVTASHDKTARIWDSHTGALLAVLAGHGSVVQTAAYSPDGNRIVTASHDKTARIWDARTGALLAVLAGHGGFVSTAVYSPDGSRIVTASYDKTARIWDARIPAPLDAQIAWDAAAQTDGLSDVDRANLGLPADHPGGNSMSTGSACDRAVAALYDPERREQGILLSDINADIANSACVAETNNAVHSARSDYEMGRALLAKHDVKGARQEFELALRRGYRAAAIDLAAVLQDKSFGIPDPARSASLLERAWNDRVPIAAYELGQMYELGLPGASAGVDTKLPVNDAMAWYWYQKGADIGEPNSVARFAERDEKIALAERSSPKKNSLLLRAFTRFAAAAKLAHDENWPADAWKFWRYRRATLARVLAREGMMPQVADAYKTVLAHVAHNKPSVW